MRRHAGPGFDPREQYRQRAHAHGFPQVAFLAAVDEYAAVTNLPWLAAADAVESHWLLEGPDHSALSRARDISRTAAEELADLEETMRRERQRRAADQAGPIELLIAGTIIGLSTWVSFALAHLIADRILELVGLRGSAVLAALAGAALALAFGLGRHR